jgi:hypothetical protein
MRIGQGRIFIQVIICRNIHVEKKLNTVYALLKGNENMKTELRLAYTYICSFVPPVSVSIIA